MNKLSSIQASEWGLGRLASYYMDKSNSYINNMTFMDSNVNTIMSGEIKHNRPTW